MPSAMKFVGGRLCLDFVNTVGGWTSSNTLREDKLETYSDLVRWAQLAGSIGAAEARAIAGVARRHPAQAAKVLSRTVALRRALYGLFKNALDGSQPAPAYLDVLSRELAIARQHQKLSPADRRFHWKWDRPQRALDCILWRVCQSAADLLTSSELSQVRRCGGPDCGWMFLDTSRNHSRRWCDMQDCGNLVKVRRFRERSAKAYSLASKRRQTASKT